MSKQRQKENAVIQTQASREEDILWLMGVEGMRLYRRQIPRWEAEQLAAPVGAHLSDESTSERRKGQIERHKKLSMQLRGSGTIGQAFERLKQAGCNGKWLERSLQSLADFCPFGRSARMYSEKEKKRAVRASANLHAAASDLEEVFDKAEREFLYSTAVEEWPLPLDRIPIVLRGIADCIRKTIADPHLPRFQAFSASFSIPWIIYEIKQKTSDHRPHYEDMATLIGAAYGNRRFSADHLKTLCHGRDSGKRNRG